MQRLGKYLSSLTKPELEELKEVLNLTDDELEVFNQLSRGKSKIEVSGRCLIGTSTVDRRIKSINQKLLRLGKIQ
jgi:DNA-binding NarL/FixJ family response regulator